MGKTKVEEKQTAPKASDALSYEGGGITEQVVGDKVFESRAGVTESGIPRIQVVQAKEQPPLGEPRGYSNEGVPPVMNAIRAQAEARRQVLERAAAEIVPGILFTVQQPTCSKFTGKNPRGEPVGNLVWCFRKECGAYHEGACSEHRLAFTPIITRRVQPATMAEYDAMITEPGAVRDPETDIRIRDRADEIATALAAADAAARAEVEARDRAILEARRIERTTPHFIFRPHG